MNDNETIFCIGNGVSLEVATDGEEPMFKLTAGRQVMYLSLHAIEQLLYYYARVRAGDYVTVTDR